MFIKPALTQNNPLCGCCLNNNLRDQFALFDSDNEGSEFHCHYLVFLGDLSIPPSPKRINNFSGNI